MTKILLPTPAETIKIQARGRFDWKHWSAPGGNGKRVLLAEGVIDNLVVTTGLNLILTSGLGTAYMALINASPAPTILAANTMASHAGWVESVDYSESVRQTWSYAIASGIASAASPSSFSMNGTVSIYGLFITSSSTKSGTSGTLISAGAFAEGSRSMQNGQTLQASYTLTLTSA